MPTSVRKQNHSDQTKIIYVYNSLHVCCCNEKRQKELQRGRSAGKRFKTGMEIISTYQQQTPLDNNKILNSW